MFNFCVLCYVTSKSRYYKERNVQSKKRKAIRRLFVSIRHGAMFLASALTEAFPPGVSKHFLIFPGGGGGVNASV